MTILNKVLRTSYWIPLNCNVIFGSYRFRFRLTGRDQAHKLNVNYHDRVLGAEHHRVPRLIIVPVTVFKFAKGRGCFYLLITIVNFVVFICTTILVSNFNVMKRDNQQTKNAV
jgi:hypothetical protein